MSNNSVHFACFGCRKAFKQRGSSNWSGEVPLRPFPCPTCKTPMIRLGKYFKAPPQRSFRQWIKVELLHHFGETFGEHTGVGKCRTIPDAILFLTREDRPASEIRMVLENIQKTRREKP